MVWADVGQEQKYDSQGLPVAICIRGAGGRHPLTKRIQFVRVAFPTLNAAAANGARGTTATVIQEWLSLNGLSVPVDGSFGSATEEAVKRFQKASGLPVTGSVDQRTLDRLMFPMKRAIATLDAGNRSCGQMVVAYAKQHLKENPREVGGENRGPWVRLYMDGSEGKEFPWCAGFVCSMYEQACESLDISMPFERSVSCDFLAVDAQRSGIFVSEKERANGTPVRPGSLFLCRNSPTDWTHTGLVVSVSADTFETIEGNTNDEGSREGYEVCRRIRAYKDKDFIVPKV